jgi:hypothetical protein
VEPIPLDLISELNEPVESMARRTRDGSLLHDIQSNFTQATHAINI